MGTTIFNRNTDEYDSVMELYYTMREVRKDSKNKKLLGYENYGDSDYNDPGKGSSLSITYIRYYSDYRDIDEIHDYEHRYFRAKRIRNRYHDFFPKFFWPFLIIAVIFFIISAFASSTAWTVIAWICAAVFIFFLLIDLVLLAIESVRFSRVINVVRRNRL